MIAAAVTVTIFAGWAIVHLVGLVVQVVHGTAGGAGGITALWLAALLLLWWVPLSWFERPFQVTVDQAALVDRLRVTVQVPVYNEDETALRACLRSVLEQTRPPTRIAVVDDGSAMPGSDSSEPYAATRHWLAATAAAAGVEATWSRTPNRGKRYAQMHALADDDADVFVTLDSDSVLDRAAIEEGLKPFADDRVMSVAGSVLVLNSHRNLLTALITILYVPFTRGFRAAQSVLGSVTVNSGTLAFYRSEVVLRHAVAYPQERFAGRPMQMNDDSMLTFYALLEGRTVHQPSSFAFTLVPETWPHYRKQALRWMRGTFVRTLWWIRYLPPRSTAFLSPVLELTQLVLAMVFGVVILIGIGFSHRAGEILLWCVLVTLLLNYLIALRYFSVVRSDESRRFALMIYLLAPVAGVWRLLVMRPMQLYAIATCWRVSSWGTRDDVAVRIGPVQAGHPPPVDDDRQTGL